MQPRSGISEVRFLILIPKGTTSTGTTGVKVRSAIKHSLLVSCDEYVFAASLPGSVQDYLLLKLNMQNVRLVFRWLMMQLLEMVSQATANFKVGHNCYS